MKKLFSLAAVALLAVTGCSKSSDTVKIGFIGPLTGDAAQYGNLMTQALKLAAEEKNAAGGINGKKIEVISEDDEAKVDKANAAVEKLISVNRVHGIVGAVFSSCSLAIAPKAEQTKTVMISPSSTHKELPDKGDFVFRTIVGDDLQARVFAKYVANIAKIKTVAILYVKNDYSQGLSDDFKTEFEKNGGKVVAMESAVQGDKDFKTQLTKIKSLKPEALYIPNYYQEMAQILEQAKQLGLSTKMLSADGYSNPEIFNLAGKLAEGVVFSNAAEETSNLDLKKQFIEKYKAKYGVEPDAFSMNSYDAANILINAIEKVYNESTDAEKKSLELNKDKIRQYVAETKNYTGVSGTISFTANGDLVKNMGIYVAGNKAYKQISVYQIDANDKLVEVK